MKKRVKTDYQILIVIIDQHIIFYFYTFIATKLPPDTLNFNSSSVHKGEFHFYQSNFTLTRVLLTKL